MSNDGGKNIKATRSSNGLQLSPWLEKRLLKDHFNFGRRAAPEKRLGERTSRLMRLIIGRRPLHAATSVVLPLSRPWAPRGENRTFLPPSWQPMTLLVSGYGRSPVKPDVSRVSRFEQASQAGTFSPDIRVNPFSETPSPVRRTVAPSHIPVVPPVRTPATQAVKRKIIRGKVEEMSGQPGRPPEQTGQPVAGLPVKTEKPESENTGTSGISPPSPAVPLIMPQPEHLVSPAISSNISSQTVQIPSPKTPKTASGPGSLDETRKTAGKSGLVSSQRPEARPSVSSGQIEKAVIAQKSLSSDSPSIARENRVSPSPVIPETKARDMSTADIPSLSGEMLPAAVLKSGTSAGEDRHAGAHMDFDSNLYENKAPNNPPQPKVPDDQPVRRKGFFASFAPVVKQIFRRRPAPAPSKNKKLENLDSPVAAKTAKLPQTESKTDKKPLVQISKTGYEETPDVQPKTNITDETRPAPTAAVERLPYMPLPGVAENFEVQQQSVPVSAQIEPLQQNVQETDPRQKMEPNPSSDSLPSDVKITTHKPELTAGNSAAAARHSGQVIGAPKQPLNPTHPVLTLRRAPIQRVNSSTELPVHRQIQSTIPSRGASQLYRESFISGRHTPPALDLPLASPVRVKADSAGTQEIEQIKHTSDISRSASAEYHSGSQPAVTNINRAEESDASLPSPSSAQTAQGVTDYKTLARDIYPYLKRMIMVEKERFPDP